MINNLNIPDPESSTWKYVDDMSQSEGLVRNSNLNIQTSLNTVAYWSSSNWMKLNTKKCKEMQLYFLNEPIDLGRFFGPHCIDQQLPVASYHQSLAGVSMSPSLWRFVLSFTILKFTRSLFSNNRLVTFTS